MRCQQGIALLTAVVLVALATIIAVAIAHQSAMTARRGGATLAYEQSILAAEAAEALAAYALKQATNTISTSDRWAQPFGPVEIVPGVTVEAMLEDAQARFNLNNLVNQYGRPDPAQVRIFEELLQNLGLETTWADKVVDWIDPDVQVHGEGAEDQIYTAFQPPYHPPNLMMTSVSELLALALPDFGRDRFLKLAPYVVALPWGTKLNTCTADGIVLDSLLGAGTSNHMEWRNQADSMNEARQKGCYPRPEDLRNTISAPDPTMQTDLRGSISNTSSYFRLTTVVTIGTAQFTLYSLLQRQGQGQPVRTLFRSQTAD